MSSVIRPEMKTFTRTSGKVRRKAATSGASSESEMLGGAESRSIPVATIRLLAISLSTASLTSALFPSVLDDLGPGLRQTHVARRTHQQARAELEPQDPPRAG